jgi:hypothetical protein
MSGDEGCGHVTGTVMTRVLLIFTEFPLLGWLNGPGRAEGTMASAEAGGTSAFAAELKAQRAARE